MSRSSLSSILGVLSATALALSACTTGCGGGSGSDPGSGGDDDTGLGDEDSGLGGDGTSDTSASDGFVLDSGSEASSSDTSAGLDTASSSDTGEASDGSGSDGATLDTSATDAGGDVGFDGSGGDGAAADSGAGADSGAPDTGTPDTTPPDPCTVGLTCAVDTDGDTIPDQVEGRCTLLDTDGDGTPDYLDLDSDGDTVSDTLEWAAGGCDETAPLNDADGDGTPNFRDLDSDGNGLVDVLEICPPATTLTKLGKPACTVAAGYDFDGDGVMDFLDNDNDHDSPSTALEVGLEDKNELVNDLGVYVGLAIDTDLDSVPDVYDVDSDNDFIYDLSDGLSDPDADGVRNFRDKDSDGDKVPDACEARNKSAPIGSDLSLALLDTDRDGKPDYVDIDSDSDLLTDGAEDKNFNCIVDSCETSRILTDTDGDGADDFIETTLDTGGACWASKPGLTPANQGKFYFIEPYSADGSLAPTPTTSLLALSTQLNNGDVGFVMDTTGSMSGVIANLKSSLSATIIPALKAKIPSLGIGVAGHDDFPYGGYGGGADLPYYNTTSSGFVTTDTTTAINAANSLVNKGGGSDGPESQVPALFHAIGGDVITWPTGSVAADTGTAGVTFGGMHFRTIALPILIELTDAAFHNGYSVKVAGLQNGYSFTTFDSAALVTKLNAVGAKFIGVGADQGGRAAGYSFYGDPYNYESYITDNTGSNVPTSAFTTCGVGKCCTGVAGAAITPDGPGGTCRSVYSCNHDGTGLGTSIVNGVYAILASIKFDVYVQAYNPGAIDVVADFMQKVEPNPAGGTDPVTGSVCVSGIPATQLGDQFVGPKAVVVGSDTVIDTIKAVNPGSYYCFNVVPKANTVIAATSVAQTFTAKLRVLAQKPAPASGTFALGTDRDVLFVVPPIVN